MIGRFARPLLTGAVILALIGGPLLARVASGAGSFRARGPLLVDGVDARECLTFLYDDDQGNRVYFQTGPKCGGLVVAREVP